MYIHIGGEAQIPAKIIVAIIDLEQENALADESVNKIFLRAMEDRFNVELIGIDVPRSLIVTLDRVYLSPISASTLRKRAEKPF